MQVKDEFSDSLPPIFSGDGLPFIRAKTFFASQLPKNLFLHSFFQLLLKRPVGRGPGMKGHPVIVFSSSFPAHIRSHSVQ